MNLAIARNGISKFNEMNQKVLQYLLVAGLVVIWGTIIYKVINGLRGDEDKIKESFKTARFNYNVSKDSFSLIADYPDPFIPAEDTSDYEKGAALKISPREADIKINEVSKPKINIQFFGIISNPQKRKKVAIISISGKEYLVTERQKIDQVVISKISKQRILVLIEGKLEEIARQDN